MGDLILVVSTLDTKGQEVAFVCERLRRLGLEPFVIDAGILGEPLALTPDISNRQVAEAAGSTLEAIRGTGSRGRAVELMAIGLRSLVADLHSTNPFRGGLGVGGLEGAVLAAAALGSLPFGIPKVSVSPIFSGVRRFDPFVGESDIALLHSVADLQGLNSVTRVVLDRAARMVAASWPALASAPPALGRIGMSLNGNTTDVGMAVLHELEREGHEVVTFHSNGVGGSSMELLASEGELDALIDLTTNELTEEIVGGLFPVKDRLLVAGGSPVPRVVLPGSLDFICQEPDRLEGRFTSRKIDRHNPEVVLVQVSAAEASQIADAFVARLLASKGPVRVVVPLRGLSLAGSPGGIFEGAGTEGTLVEAIQRAARLGRLPLLEVDAPINDHRVADAVVSSFRDLVGQRQSLTA